MNLIQIYEDVSANMDIPAEEKYANLHGEQAVRLNSGVSIFESAPRKVSRRFSLISLMLFSAPRRHLLAIETMSIDGIVSRQAWNQFSSAVQKMCSDLTVYVSLKVTLCGLRFDIYRSVRSLLPLMLVSLRSSLWTLARIRRG